MEQDRQLSSKKLFFKRYKIVAQFYNYCVAKYEILNAVKKPLNYTKDKNEIALYLNAGIFLESKKIELNRIFMEFNFLSPNNEINSELKKILSYLRVFNKEINDSIYRIQKQLDLEDYNGVFFVNYNVNNLGEYFSKMLPTKLEASNPRYINIPE